MKKNDGITMLSLVLTVVILIMISSITVRVGLQSYNGVKIQNYISQLKVIQSKVDKVAENISDVDFNQFKRLSSMEERRNTSIVFCHSC